jgi:hypothetical protein
MSPTVEGLLHRNLREVFSERDETRRRRAIGELMTDDVVFSDRNRSQVGQDALNAAVAALQARLPPFVFSERTPPQTIADAGHVAWQFGPPGELPRVTGMDFIVVRDGKIAALYVFLDPPGGQGAA